MKLMATAAVLVALIVPAQASSAIYGIDHEWCSFGEKKVRIQAGDENDLALLISAPRSTRTARCASL